LALTQVAQTLLTAGNTTEAGRIALDTERIANNITDDYRRKSALADIAKTLAAAGNITDAERIARTTNDEYQLTSMLTEIAKTLAAAGKHSRRRTHCTFHHRRVSLDAERIARTITDDYRRNDALTHLAKTLAAARNTNDGGTDRPEYSRYELKRRR